MHWSFLCEPRGDTLLLVTLPQFSKVLDFGYILANISLLQEDFFVILHNILAEMEEVSELQPVPDAHVPVMKFKFQGISIDLLYASISLLVVPEVSLVIHSAGTLFVLRAHFCGGQCHLLKSSSLLLLQFNPITSPSSCVLDK